MRVPYIQLGAQYAGIKAEILDKIGSLLDSGQFILGDEVSAFETAFAKLCGTKYAVGVANGTDALFLSLRGIGLEPGDEVITAPNSYLASASSIALAGGVIRFADVRSDYNIDPEKLSLAITPKTKAVIAVHLTGKPADMDAIQSICSKHDIALIEDCAQAVGAEYHGKPVGSFGVSGCFSLHPLKNLSACGDAGIITTNDDNLYAYLIKARNHGLKSRDECEFWSYNSRIDALQAAILNVKLKELDRWTSRRREIASMYRKGLSGLPLQLPLEGENEKAVYHTFIIQSKERDSLKEYLLNQGVDTKIHYPISIYQQEAASTLPYKTGDFPETDRQTREILSLPVYPELTNDQVRVVIDSIKEFYKQA